MSGRALDDDGALRLGAALDQLGGAAPRYESPAVLRERRRHAGAVRLVRTRVGDFDLGDEISRHSAPPPTMVWSDAIGWPARVLSALKWLPATPQPCLRLTPTLPSPACGGGLGRGRGRQG